MLRLFDITLNLMNSEKYIYPKPSFIGLIVYLKKQNNLRPYNFETTKLMCYFMFSCIQYIINFY